VADALDVAEAAGTAATPRGDAEEDLAAEAAAEATTAEECVTGKTEDNSWLVFFDQSATLCSLFPGLAARVENGDSAIELFNNLTKEEMMQMPPAAGDVTEQRALLQKEISGSTRKGSKHSATSSLRGKTATISGQESSTTLGDTGKSRSGAETAVAKLTAENLQKIGKPVKAPSERRSITGFSDARSGSKLRASVATQFRPAAEATPDAVRQAIPDFWQTGVRRNLRRCLEDKNIRQATIHKHMDAMRREVEGT
jgi:hypothetical protein